MSIKSIATWICSLTCLFVFSVAFAAKCAFIDMPSFDFGSVSFHANHISTVGKVVFWCTKGASYALVDSDDVNVKKAHVMHLRGGSTDIPYQLSYNATGVGMGRHVPITVPIRIDVFLNNKNNLVAGTYLDRVKLSLTY